MTRQLLSGCTVVFIKLVKASLWKSWKVLFDRRTLRFVNIIHSCEMVHIFCWYFSLLLLTIFTVLRISTHSIVRIEWKMNIIIFYVPDFVESVDLWTVGRFMATFSLFYPNFYCSTRHNKYNLDLRPFIRKGFLFGEGKYFWFWLSPVAEYQPKVCIKT